MIPTRHYDSKARPEFSGEDPPLLVHRNRARPLAVLITLVIVAGLCPARFYCAQPHSRSAPCVFTSTDCAIAKAWSARSCSLPPPDGPRMCRNPSGPLRAH